jgi:hypothetical protein
MADYNPVAFGYSLRTHRRKLGWSAFQLAALYAEFVGREDSPPNPAFIYHIERGTTIVSQERRAILASLVGMSLVAQAPFDVAEYAQALCKYCEQYRSEGTLKQERGAIEARINRLEATVLQTFDTEKRQMLELLGFYQVIHADTWRGQQPSIVYALILSALEIAQQERFPALLVYALILRAGLAISRFELTLKSEILECAIRDIYVALDEQDKLEAIYAGLLYLVKGLLDAYTAYDRQSFASALHLMTRVSNLDVDDDPRITTRLDEERCMLMRTSAYLYAPMGDAKLGLAALQELELAYPEARGKRRLVQRHQLWAFAYLATGDYPMAAAHLEAAVENASEDCIDSLIQIHTRLKNTSYGNDPDIGRIAVKIHQMKYPELFL